MQFRTMALIGLALAAQTQSVAAQGAAGPRGTLYLIDGDHATGAIVHGSSFTNFTLAGGFQYPISVNGGVVTTHTGSGSATYDITGSSLGTAGGPSLIGYDGTTNGTNLYEIQWANGAVYQYDAGWTNPTFLFNTASSNLGITYDPFSNSLWTMNFGGGFVQNWSMTGTLLSQFNTALGNTGFLAMDYTDGTLWTQPWTQPNLYNYDTSGNLIGIAAYGTLGGDNYLGGEFDVTTATTTPEPGSMALVATGLGALVLRRRRKNA